jgi:hypothetical protein
MQTSFDSLHGTVDLETAASTLANDNFGYTLFEEVVDPQDPEGIRAIAMHVPPHSMSKVWQLVEEGYSETIELLHGEATLVVGSPDESEWTSMPLTDDNPTADDVVLVEGNAFCIVTDDSEAVVLSRPSMPFDISYETGLTQSPQDKLSKFVLSHARSAIDT